MDNIVILSDEIRGLVGMPYAVGLIARYLRRIGFSVFVISTYISDEAKSILEKDGITSISLTNFPLADTFEISYLLNFVRETLLEYNSRLLNNINYILNNAFVLNFSNYFTVNSHIWYGGGAISYIIQDIIEDKMPQLLPFINITMKYIDKIFLNKINTNSIIKCFVSQFARQRYSLFGLSSSCVIHLPIDADLFKPIESPASDYVVVYFGKETKYNIVKAMLDAGIKMKAYGGKGARYAPHSLLEHKNLEFLGYVSYQKLRELYANALYTAFPFTTEPFGYVPVESMACGTPVLTYNKQGPAETVENGISGWLVQNDDEFIRISRKIWKKGYNFQMRIASRKRGQLFDYRKIGKKWTKLIDIINTYQLIKQYRSSI